MKALVHLAYGENVPDCTSCEGDPRLRAKYGCDGPSWLPCNCRGQDAACTTCEGTGHDPTPAMYISCGHCGGTGYAPPDDDEPLPAPVPGALYQPARPPRACEHCAEGEFGLHRCPMKLTEERPDIRRIFQHCQHYPLLPAVGGLADQAAGYVTLLEVFRSEKNRVLTERHKKEQKAAGGGGRSH